MAAPTRTRLTAAAGRKFGLTLAFGFLVLGALLAWRGLDIPARILWGVAALSVCAALLVPTRLGPVERGWMAFGVALSRVVRPVFFTIVYLAVITPAGLFRRTFGRSPLARDPDSPSHWQRREARDPAAIRRSLERQF